MRVKFKLRAKDGYAGDLHAFWNEKYIPRTGDKIKLNNIFSEGIFLPCEELLLEESKLNNLKKDAKTLKQHLRKLNWVVTETIKSNRDGEPRLLLITVNEL